MEGKDGGGGFEGLCLEPKKVEVGGWKVSREARVW